MSISKTRRAFEALTGHKLEHLVLNEAETGVMTLGFAYYDNDELMIHVLDLPASVHNNRPIELLFGDILATIVNQVIPDDADLG